MFSKKNPIKKTSINDEDETSSHPATPIQSYEYLLKEIEIQQRRKEDIALTLGYFALLIILMNYKNPPVALLAFPVIFGCINEIKSSLNWGRELKKMKESITQISFLDTQYKKYKKLLESHQETSMNTGFDMTPFNIKKMNYC